MTPKKTETQNTGYWSSSGNTEKILTQEDKIKLGKKLMAEKKISLSSIENNDMNKIRLTPSKSYHQISQRTKSED